LNKGDLFVYNNLSENPKLHRTSLGICLEPWGWNSHGEKMYKVLIGEEIDIVTEKEISIINTNN